MAWYFAAPDLARCCKPRSPDGRHGPWASTSPVPRASRTLPCFEPSRLRSGVCSSTSGTVSRRDPSRARRVPFTEPSPAPSASSSELGLGASSVLEDPPSSWVAPGGELRSRFVSIEGLSWALSVCGAGGWKGRAICEELARRGWSLCARPPCFPGPMVLVSETGGERDTVRPRKAGLPLCCPWDRAYDARSAVSLRTLCARYALSTGAAGRVETSVDLRLPARRGRGAGPTYRSSRRRSPG